MRGVGLGGCGIERGRVTAVWSRRQGGVPLAHAGPSGDVQQRPGEELRLNLLYGIQRIRTWSPAGSVAIVLADERMRCVQWRPNCSRAIRGVYEVPGVHRGAGGKAKSKDLPAPDPDAEPGGGPDKRRPQVIHDDTSRRYSNSGAFDEGNCQFYDAASLQ
jgi:hypothetical protein